MRPCLLALFTALALLVPCAPARAAWLWPVEGEVITAYRNGDDPYAAGQHRGIDIAAPLGTPVRAAAGGEVLNSGVVGTAGLTVSVRTSEGVDTTYLHLSAASVREGDRVAPGDPIGAVGATGSRSAEEPHLHFGVRESGSRHAYRDPLAFLSLPPFGSPEAPPRPEPAPLPLPAPPAFVPEAPPSPAPRTAPEPRRVPAGRRVPARPRVRVPRRLPVPPGVGAPAPAPARAAQPRGAPARIGPRAAPAAPLPVAREAPLSGPEPGQAARRPSAPAVPAPAPQAAVAPAPPSASGPGPGFLLACLGLLLAAALLGLTEDGRRATRRGRSAVLGLLRARG